MSSKRVSGFSYPPGGRAVWLYDSPAGELLRTEALGLGGVVEISFCAVGIPEASALPDLAANQTLGDFSQTATAAVDVSASATQTMDAFGQSADAVVQVDASATQTLGDFEQSASAEAEQPASLDVQVSFVSLGIPFVEQVAPPSEPTSAVTPGIERGPRYRVRVGRKWLTVDPLDAQSVQAAVLAAQEAAQDAAETRVVAPQRSAARVVAVRPVSASSVDYAGLAQEAARISEQIREVYAQALQRELIARLVREQIDEDEDDSVLLLFG